VLSKVAYSVKPGLTEYPRRGPGPNAERVLLPQRCIQELQVVETISAEAEAALATRADLPLGALRRHDQLVAVAVAVEAGGPAGVEGAVGQTQPDLLPLDGAVPAVLEAAGAYHSRRYCWPA
jgi:hypothetical protein